MPPRVVARWLALLLASLAFIALGLILPASACGCGAFVADDRLRVDAETSIVRFDGDSEQIVMRLAVQSDLDDAAWIMPTPSAASAELGRERWFEDLARVTRPHVVYRDEWWPEALFDNRGDGVGAPQGGVNVLGMVRLGAFEVSTLEAGNADALARWLSEHGYKLPDRLAEALHPYVERKWFYIAIKIAPGAKLTGTLDPLSIKFRTKELVYPMRLSRLASTPQHVRLFVLADHRVSRTDDDRDTIPLAVDYAGWITPDQVGEESRTLVTKRLFVTELAATIARPERITDDFRFQLDPVDKEQHRTRVVAHPVYIMGVAGGPLLVGMPLLLLTGLLGLTLVLVLTRRPR